jgi:DNA replicative helicase MCM subunit Mcm2 (Cdc46/Mcm family)
MDWNPDRVFEADAVATELQVPSGDMAIIEEFRRFLHEFPGSANDFPYRQQIADRRAREDYYIELDIDNLQKSGFGHLATSLKTNPTKYLPLVWLIHFFYHPLFLISFATILGSVERCSHHRRVWSSANPALVLCHAATSTGRRSCLNPATERLLLFYSCGLVPTTSIATQDSQVGSLVAVRGLVLQSSRVTSALSQATIQCRSCRSMRTLLLDPLEILTSGGKLVLPRSCEKFHHLHFITHSTVAVSSYIL